MKNSAHTLMCVAGAALLFAAVLRVPPTVRAAAAPPQQAAPRGGSDQTVAIAAGQAALVTNCGFCHGSDARGGAEGGPDLTRSLIATSGPELTAFLKVGRPPRMPAFDLPDAQVLGIVAYVNSQKAPAGGRDAGDPRVILVGNADAGKAYFNGAGKCVSCHSVTGDLKDIGSKYDPKTLQGRMVLARGSGGYPGLRFAGAAATVDVPRTVVVTPTTGNAVRGELVTISDYLVTVKESSGSVRTFTRDGDVPKVVITDPLQPHIDMLPKWTSQHLHDLTAYLVTLK